MSCPLSHDNRLAMPNPKKLQIGDRIRFVTLPDEWDDPKFHVHDDTIELVTALVERGRSSRVCEIADDGYPWIKARLRQGDGTIVYHSLGIYEATGWVRVARRGSARA